MKRPRVAATLVATAMLLGGCTVGPGPRTYVLGSAAEAQPEVRVETGLPVVEIEPVSVPDYLDSREILISRGPNEMVASPSGRWAERLSLGIADALAVALARRLPDRVVTTKPLGVAGARQLLVDIVTFEIRPDGNCVLGARWTVTETHGRRVLHGEHDTFTAVAATANDADIAAAITQALDKLADRIAAALKAAG